MEYLIIGAGPAGLQLGYFLEQAGHDYLILEAGSGPGTFFRSFPRHRRLISINKPHTGWTDSELNLRVDWNSLLSDDPRLRFTKYSERYFPDAEDLVRYLTDFASTHRLRVQYDTRVREITRNGHFCATDQHGFGYDAQRLIVATGVPRLFMPAIPGIETADVYDTVSVNPRDFVDQKVLIIGKGNSAFETADGLMETAAVIHVAGPGSIKFAWKSHFVGHLRAVNNNLLDTYQLKSQNALLDGNIERIERGNDGSYLVTVSFARANEVKKDIHYDRVIVCTGFRFDGSIFHADCRPALTIRDRFPDQTSEWESTNIPDLYFAGTLMQMRDYKKSTCGFIHGFRYGIRALHHMLERKYHSRPWPNRRLPADPENLMDAVIARVNRTSALWQLFGFLCDLIVVSPEGAEYYDELPVAYVHELFNAPASYFVITLEYGPDHDRFDPFDISVGRIAQNDAARSSMGRYLHPVMRHYRRGELLSEHHVTENLENEWTDPITHREPLRAFLHHEMIANGKTAELEAV